MLADFCPSFAPLTTTNKVAAMPTLRSFPRLLLAVLLSLASFHAAAQFAEPILNLAKKERQPLLDTLKDVVSIESGSRDIEGLDKLANLIADRLKALGGQVEVIDPAPADIYRMHDTPEKPGKAVRATFKGTGKKKILLIAHMDTVYQRGMLEKQPFRIDGNRAYGLGIADDKQGVAVILHTVAMLKGLNFKEYGTLTILINGDEEISSPGSRNLITRLGAEHDATMSFEAATIQADKLSLATAGIASVTLKVKGRASHAGSSPHLGINALYELAHQILQTKDLQEPEVGLKMNWTLATAGMNRNVIPPDATATADVRVQRVADYDKIEQKLREKIKTQLISDAKVEVDFERRRPPLEANDASREFGKLAQRIFKELGKDLVVDEVVAGGGTDAAFAGLKTKNAVLERFGLQGFGAHTTDAEYVLLDSIEPKLYLATRLIMEFSRGKTK
jgi:glutamate carboxypeptidase